MNIHRPHPHEPRGGETPPALYQNRRAWLRAAGFAGGAALLAGTGGLLGWRRWRGTPEEVLGEGRVFESTAAPPLGAVPRDDRFTYGRPETDRVEAARYTNFYEFSNFKWSWRLVDSFQPLPWEIAVGGLCRAPLKFDYDEFLARYRDALVERQYRFRCVERWAMAIPWIGVPLARVLRDCDPLAAATHVRFVSFHRPEEAPQQKNLTEYPWPYTEGLSIAEARIDLVLLAVGMYGEPLLKQHGAPIRLVVPWKYGYKSIKSVQRIELVDSQPATFWSTINGAAYPFESNVDPRVPRPWPQGTETMLGSREVHETLPYNGYGEYVAQLYG